MSKGQTQSSPPTAFYDQVCDLLQHLYDYAYLERHPMATLWPLGSAHKTAAAALRDLLLDAMERIHPEGRRSGDERVWRPYDILMLRYSDGYAPDDVAARLHVSRRQFQRDHRKGLEAVTAVLWHGADQEVRRAFARDPALSGEQPGDLASASAGSLGAVVADMSLQLQSVKLGELTASALTYAAALVEANECSLALPPRAPEVWVRVDVMLARQAILAAVSALSRRCGGEVQVRYGEPDAMVSLYVTRRGHGALGDDALSAHAEDVSSLLEAQGGRLQTRGAESEIAWELCLPRAKPQRVLVVDDNERFLRLFERFLAAEGYDFEGVSGPEVALSTIASRQPDLVIVDVMMRGMDGWDLIQRMRMPPASLEAPIVVCSVLNESGLAQALGAQGYLKKPVTQTEVLETVRRLLDGYSPAERPTAGH